MQWTVEAPTRSFRYVVLIGVCTLMIGGLSVSAQGASETTSGLDITGLQLDKDLADVFPEDEAILAGDADQETKDDAAADYQEVHMAADITGLHLDGNLADIFDEDGARAAAAGWMESTVAPDTTGLNPTKDLAAVRAATAKFHRVDAALAAGYELGYVNGSGVRIITGCIAHPTDGAMGYHYFNKQLIDDLVVDSLKPEGLVYAPGPNGQLRLVAVEYVVPGLNSNPPGVSDPPTVLGMQMHILVPAVGFHTLHAWIWGHNPSGMFAHWNPEVVCP